MTILGVDPGTLITGYGVIQSSGSRIRVVTAGAIRNNSRRPMAERLKLIFDSLVEIIRQYRPDEFAIETAFYGKNAQSALKLGHARGVSMLAAILEGLPTHEYSPREVKKAIAGSGTATKEQVLFMISTLLQLRERPRCLDTSDALAVAVCHLHRSVISQRPAYRSWKAYLAAHPEKVSAQKRIPAA